ncbi:MAG: hypothetical protein H7A23_19440 [Leptospiraceae bacterium]|nr:hypothetical protein [Leptospiraceae bacterium]MCP5496729.1 hypothetical protein [Leptospiraceae bacterium]
MYNLLFNENLTPESLENELSLVFEQIVNAVGANCGTIALAPVGKDYFIECAISGYGQDGFYYGFLSRGGGHLEKVEASILPLIFYAKEFKLYFNYSDFALVSRIIAKRGNVVGFVLFEFTGVCKDIMSLFIGMFANRVGQIYSLKYKNDDGEKAIEFSDKSDFGIIELLVSFSSGFEKINSDFFPPVLLIGGGNGSGKKSLAKYIYRKFEYSGDFIFINSIPEQLGKLEKSLENWTKMIRHGVIVFDGVDSFNVGQQNLFYQFLQKEKKACSLFFIDRNESRVDTYQPFWDILNENSVFLPKLNLLDKIVLLEVIRKMFYELKLLHGRSGLKLSNRTLDLLAKHDYSENLKELRGLLENSIVRAKGSEIDLDENYLASTCEPQPITLTNEDLNLRKCVENMERQKIILASKLFAGNQMRMSKALGISRGSLQYKMKQFDLEF